MMFYEENEIKDLLVCKLCHQRLVDPRVLSCGNTVCKGCIDAIYNQQTKGIECLFCLKQHVKPANEIGFPPNELIAKLAQKRPKEVYRGREFQALKDRLDQLNERCDLLGGQFKDIPEKIRDKTTSVRNRIDLVADELVELINTYRNDLIAQVNLYEERCMNTYVNNYLDFNCRLEEFFGQLRLFHNHWSTYLRKPIIDENKMKKIDEHAKSWLDKINKLDSIFRRIAFDDKVLQFEVNNLSQVKSNILGNLVYQHAVDCKDDINDNINNNSNLLN
jgi:hypothetical protein